MKCSLAWRLIIFLRKSDDGGLPQKIDNTIDIQFSRAGFVKDKVFVRLEGLEPLSF